MSEISDFEDEVKFTILGLTNDFYAKFPMNEVGDRVGDAAATLYLT